MATTNINVRVDSVLKQEAETLFNDLGLNMSSAINMFLRSAINHRSVILNRTGFLFTASIRMLLNYFVCGLFEDKI